MRCDGMTGFQTQTWRAAVRSHEAVAGVHRSGLVAVVRGVGGRGHVERRVRHQAAQVGGSQQGSGHRPETGLRLASFSAHGI
jgi:hypothetical protein